MEIDGDAEIQPAPSSTPAAVAENRSSPSTEPEDVTDEESTELKPHPARPPRRRRRRGISLSFILNALTLGLGSWAAVLQWDKHIAQPSVEFIVGAVCGAFLGLSWTRQYKQTKQLRSRKQRILNYHFSPHQLDALMKQLPDWVDFAHAEKASSANRLIHEMWRYYDTAICKEIAKMVEPLFLQYKPGFINDIKFKKLTFGDAPFKITHVSVMKEDEEEIILEMGIRWDGTACVAIGIDVYGAGTFTPGIRRLMFYATVRLCFTRMVPRIPAIGAMLLSFQNAPLVTFDLDCGAGIGELIEAWLIPFLKNDILGNLLVWPNRIVIPMQPASITGPLHTLKLHTRGVLKVIVVEAENLPKSDFTGKGDPFALLETVAFKPVRTKVIKNTSAPKWNETHYLKVQELDQCLRVTVRDQESSIVGALTFQTSELQGRTLIPIEDLVEGESVDSWYDLGKGDWGEVGGPGSGSGRIHLVMSYYTLNGLREGRHEAQESTHVARGLFFVTVNSGNNLGSLQGTVPPDPYCVLWLSDTKKTTRVLRSTRDPVWNYSVDWSNVEVTETLYVEIYDKGTVSDRLLGKTQTSILPIAKDFTDSQSHRPMECTLDLEGEKGDVMLTMEWVPLDKVPLPKLAFLPRAGTSIDHSQPGVLFVKLVSGEDLKNVDLVGLSDPYCILKIGGSPKLSRYIANNLNPVWNEDFKWIRVRETTVLHGEVFDKGSVADRILGVFQLSVSAALDPPGEVHGFTVELKKKKKKEELAGGRIHLQLCWKAWRRDSDEEEPSPPEWPEFNET